MSTEKTKLLEDPKIETITVVPVDGAGEYTGILLSTLWSQSGILDLGDNDSITYNEYTPLDPKDSKHCVTGCTNTAAAQIIHYFIENNELTLSLTLEDGDAYKSTDSITVKADGSTPGTISFTAVNKYLESYDVKSAECAAALLYACGVVQQAEYGSSETGTAWNAKLFYRAGFQSANHFYTQGALSDYWGKMAEDGKFAISDAGYEVIIENLVAGRPVGTSYPGHALVIDGYDGAKDLFHINFGWGKYASDTKWYSREEMHEQGYWAFVYDLYPEHVETLTVTDERVYGTGTMVRAFEQARTITGSNTVVFSKSVKGGAVGLAEHITLKDSITVRDFNMTVTVASTLGMGFYCDGECNVTFENFGGAFIVNTDQSNNWAVAFLDGGSLSFSANGTLLYAGSYAVGGDYSAGATAILNAMRSAGDTATEVADFVTEKASCSFYATDNDDLIALDNRSVVVGDIALQGGSDTITVEGGSQLYADIEGSGDNTITVEGGSHLYGNISCAATITVDNSSAIDGSLSAKSKVNLVLDSAAQEHAIFTVEGNVNSLYTNATVTVDVTEARVGVYTLFAAAAGASNADKLKDIKLTVTGDGKSDYTLCGNGVTAGNCVDLVCESGALKLNVTSTPSDVTPKVVSVSADVTAVTNQDVTVTATFNKYVAIQQYSLDNSTWQEYTDGVVMSHNGTVYFRGIDAENHISEVVSLDVLNIDKVAPDKPVAAADITEPTDQDVTVTATFPDDAATKQYSTDGETWLEYAAGVTLQRNGQVFFRAIDEAGNISDVTTFAVGNIITTPPDAPVAVADITEPTNLDVTVTATFSDDTATKQYSLDGENWLEYASGVVMPQNGKVHFRGLNAYGYASDVVIIVVSNIDKVAPAKPKATADITSPTDLNVTVSAVFTAESVGREYSLDGETWNAYESGVVMTDNGIVYFRAIDEVGNVSEITEYEVANIDRIAPDAPTVTLSTTALTNRDVTVEAAFPDDAAVKQYSTDGEEWRSYTGALTAAANGNFFFRAIDAVGNVSEVTECAVTNIDKTAPEQPTVSADVTAATNGDVTVTAAFADDCELREYSLDNRTWQTYTEGIVLAANGKVYFRGTDAAGNVSPVAECDVANIDKTIPGKPAVSADIMTVTNKAVTVTATFSDDAAVKQYSLDGENWQTYTDGVVLSANGKVYFRSINAVGTVSPVAEYEVANIDKTAPDRPGAAADITSPTRQSVTVTATFPDDSVLRQYSRDGKNWNNYSSGVVMEENGTVWFRGIDATGNASETLEYQVTNIDRTPPAVPGAEADVTAKTTGSVTVTAAFSADSAVREYSMDGKNWQPYTSGVVMKKNGKVYFRAADAAGNVSGVGAYTVANIVDSKLLCSGTIPAGATAQQAFTVRIDKTGWYRIGNASFGQLTGSVTIMDGDKKVASGTVKKGVLSFQSDAMLYDTAKYTVVVKNSDKRASGSYSFTLDPSGEGDNTDDTREGAKRLAAGGIANDWVGGTDAVDCYELGVDARGGFYDLGLSGVRNNVKLTVFAADGRKVKTVTASAKKPAVALADLCLADGSYAVVEAPKAAKGRNSDYTLKFTQKATFTGAENNDWAQAEVLEKGATFAGTLTKAAGGDVVDYCDVSKIDSLSFDMTEGKTKVSFFDADRRAVKAALKLANGAEKTAASLTLAANNGTTDHFTIAAIDDAVKYLKIEAAGKALNTYTITKIA